RLRVDAFLEPLSLSFVVVARQLEIVSDPFREACGDDRIDGLTRSPTAEHRLPLPPFEGRAVPDPAVVEAIRRVRYQRGQRPPRARRRVLVQHRARELRVQEELAHGPTLAPWRRRSRTGRKKPG